MRHEQFVRSGVQAVGLQGIHVRVMKRWGSERETAAVPTYHGATVRSSTKHDGADDLHIVRAVEAEGAQVTLQSILVEVLLHRPNQSGIARTSETRKQRVLHAESSGCFILPILDEGKRDAVAETANSSGSALRNHHVVRSGLLGCDHQHQRISY